MIQAEELYRTLHRQPFQPFRVRLKDGRCYDIGNEHLAVVGQTYLAVGIPLPNERDHPWPLCDYVDTVDLADIVRVESLSPSGAA
jgi:hypothetical protein